jgi:hypothetical protein
MRTWKQSMALQERVQILGRHTHRVRGTHAGARGTPVRIICAVSAGRSLHARASSFTKVEAGKTARLVSLGAGFVGTFCLPTKMGFLTL